MADINPHNFIHKTHRSKTKKLFKLPKSITICDIYGHLNDPEWKTVFDTRIKRNVNMPFDIMILYKSKLTSNPWRGHWTVKGGGGVMQPSLNQ